MQDSPQLNELLQQRIALKKQKLLLQNEKLRRLRASKVLAYCKYIPIPGAPLNEEDEECDSFYAENVTPAHHHEVIIDALQRVEDGEIKRLMILAPPGSSKSSYASVAFPTHYMGAKPNSNVIMVTYGSDLAKKFGRKCRQIVRSKEFQETFQTGLTGDNAAVDDWSLTNGSTYMCGGVLSGITGNRADCLLGGTIVETTDGPFSLKEIFDSKKDFYVLSYDERGFCYRKILAKTSKEVPSYLRIRTADGRVVEATRDHRFYTENGYKRADILSASDDLLCVVPQDICNQRSRSEKEGEGWRGDILQQAMFDEKSEFYKIRGKEMLGVRERCAIWVRRKKEVLLEGLHKNRKGEQKGWLKERAGAYLRILQHTFLPENHNKDDKVLQQGVQRQRTRQGYDGRQESWLAKWRTSIKNPATCCESLQNNTPTHYQKRWWEVCGMFGRTRSARPSYRYECSRQQMGEFGDVMQPLPYDVARRGEVKAKKDFVAMVEPIHEPATVYDIQVEGTECFFANGILVHNCLIIDDPFKGREDAESATIREKTWEEYTSSLRTRLKPDGALVIINTRWHMDDLSGKILPKGYSGESGWITAQDGEKWFVVCIPAQADREDDILGRRIGEWLWTEWFPAEWWEQTKKTQARNWLSLYQQRPVGLSGAILKSNWWRLWPMKEPPKFEMIIQSYDTAFMEKEESDSTARTTWGLFYYQGKDGAERAGAMMIEAKEAKVDFPELREMVLEGYKEYKPDIILIENKGSGISLIQELQRTTNLPIKKIDVKGDKVSRAHIVSGVLEGGAIWYMDREWAKMVISQCAQFPKGAHDDIVDSCTQAWNFFRKRFAMETEHEEIPLPQRPGKNKGFKGYGN